MIPSKLLFYPSNTNSTEMYPMTINHIQAHINT